MHKAQRPETKPGYSISCHNIPDAFVNDKLVIKKYFQKYGKVVRIVLRPKRKACLVEFSNEESAHAAVIVGGNFEGQKFQITWAKQKGGDAKVKRPSKKREWREDSEVLAELEAMNSTFNVDNIYSPNTRGRDVGPPILQKKPKPKKTVLIKASTPLKTAKKIIREPKLEKKPTPKQEIVSIINSEQATELLKIITKRGETSEDKYRILDARDKLIRMKILKQSNLSKVGKTIGTCPDMCPEKERLMREAQHQVALYEQLGDNRGSGMNHALAVKQYSRSSADQEAPLAHELRPVDVLGTTMSYLMHKIADLCDFPDVNLGEWFHFMWDRTRGIRKDITQQELCCQGSVRLVEQCARFHIHCSARLVAEDPSVFDQKINTENLTKCLQTLKYMYHDLAVQGEKCPNEAEFRGYVVLLNLNDGNFMWELQQLNREIQESSEVKFALQVYSALDKNNYVRFFKLVHSTTYLNACILLRYFNQVRLHALRRVLKSYSPRQPYTTYPVPELSSILAFENNSSTVEFLEYYGLSVNPHGSQVLLDRKMFSSPDLPFQNDRAINVVESKRSSSVGEIICGGPLPPKGFEKIVPHNSFDQDGYLKNSEIPSEWRSKCKDLSFEEELSISDTSTEIDLNVSLIGEKPTPAFTFCLPKKPEISFDSNLKLPSPRTSFSFTNPQNIKPKTEDLSFGAQTAFSFINQQNLKQVESKSFQPQTTFSFTKPTQLEVQPQQSKPSSLFEVQSFDIPDFSQDKIYNTFFGGLGKESELSQTIKAPAATFSFQKQLFQKSESEKLLPISFDQNPVPKAPLETGNRASSFSFVAPQAKILPKTSTDTSFSFKSTNEFSFGAENNKSFSVEKSGMEKSGSEMPKSFSFTSSVPQTSSGLDVLQNEKTNSILPNVSFGIPKTNSAAEVAGFKYSTSKSKEKTVSKAPEKVGTASDSIFDKPPNFTFGLVSGSSNLVPKSQSHDFSSEASSKTPENTSTTFTTNFSAKAPSFNFGPTPKRHLDIVSTSAEKSLQVASASHAAKLSFKPSTNTNFEPTAMDIEPPKRSHSPDHKVIVNFGPVTSSSKFQSSNQPSKTPKSSSKTTSSLITEEKLDISPKPKLIVSKPDENILKDIKLILEKVLKNVDKNLERNMKLKKISKKIQKRKILNYAKQWKRNAQISRLRRKEFYDNPVWVSTKTVDEEAKNLYMESQNINLDDKRRYLGGKMDNVVPRLPEIDGKKLDVYKTVWKILYDKSLAMNRPSLSIFWKIEVSILRHNSFSSQMWEKMVYSLLDLDGKEKILKCQNGGHMEIGGHLVYSLQKVNNSVNGSNGILIILDSSEIESLFKNCPKLIGNAPVPVLILILNSNLIQNKISIIENLNLKSASNYEIILVENGVTPVTVFPLIMASLQWLAHNLPPSPPYEMDSLESLLNKTIGEEFWLRLTANSDLNNRLKILLKDPNVTINLFNSAIDLLKDNLFNRPLDPPEFPNEFKQFLNLSFIRLPATYEYFLETWKDDLKKVRTFIDTLYLPNFNQKWPQIGLRETIETLESFCLSCNASSKTFNNIVKYLATFINFDKGSSESICQISFTEIIRLIINEKIINLHQNGTLLVVYKVETIKDFCETPWWYRTEEILTKIKTVSVDFAEDEEEEEECLKESVVGNETFDIDFNQTLNDVTMFIETEEAKIDDKVKVEYNELNTMITDLKESLDIQNKIMKRFKELTDNALNDTLFSESFENN